jgi:hypothetical protein
MSLWPPAEDLPENTCAERQSTPLSRFLASNKSVIAALCIGYFAGAARFHVHTTCASEDTGTSPFVVGRRLTGGQQEPEARESHPRSEWNLLSSTYEEFRYGWGGNTPVLRLETRKAKLDALKKWKASNEKKMLLGSGRTLCPKPDKMRRSSLGGAYAQKRSECLNATTMGSTRSASCYDWWTDALDPASSTCVGYPIPFGGQKLLLAEPNNDEQHLAQIAEVVRGMEQLWRQMGMDNVPTFMGIPLQQDPFDGKLQRAHVKRWWCTTNSIVSSLRSLPISK